MLPAPAPTSDASRYAQLARLQMEHSLYDKRLQLLMSRPLLSPADQWEEVRLKKLKLKLKDEIEAIRVGSA